MTFLGNVFFAIARGDKSDFAEVCSLWALVLGMLLITTAVE